MLLVELNLQVTTAIIWPDNMNTEEKKINVLFNTFQIFLITTSTKFDESSN